MGLNKYAENKFKELFKTSFSKFLEAIKKKPRQFLRVNTLKTSDEELKTLLVGKGFGLKRVKIRNRVVPNVFEITESPFSAGASIEFLLGCYYLQDWTSTIPCLELKPTPSDVVLDMCAAPGGKSTHASQLMNDQGVVISVDINKQKMIALRSNIERLGITNQVLYRTDVNTFCDKLSKKKFFFDKVILDVPCTGSGVLHKNPRRGVELNEEETLAFSRKQKQLILSAKKILKPGGVLVYSTCSLFAEENEEVVSFALENGFNTVPLRTSFHEKGLLKNTARFYPHVHGTQGFFLANLKKGA